MTTNISKNIRFAIALLFAIIALLTIVAQQAKREINQAFTQLENSVYDFTWAHEKLTTDYQAYKNDDDLIKEDAHNTLLAQFEYIKAATAIGGLISKDTFCKILALSLRTNAILNPGDTVESKNLMSEKEYLQAKQDILFSLYKENANYIGFKGTMAAIFGNDQLLKYKRLDCGL